MDKTIQSGVRGLSGYLADPGNEIMPDVGMLAKDLEDAKAQCEKVWDAVKSKINKY